MATIQPRTLRDFDSLTGLDTVNNAPPTLVARLAGTMLQVRTPSRRETSSLSQLL
jgi:hypothetical protein